MERMRKNDNEVRRVGKTTRLIALLSAVFVLLSVGFGAGLLIMNAVDDAAALVKLEGVKLKEGEVRYFASIYKATYMAALTTAGVENVSDTDAFWSRTADDGKTYGEKLQLGFMEYLRGMLAASRIFYQYSKYTAEDRAAVNKAVTERVTYTAGGSIERFNEMSKAYGFTYDDFASAAAYLYRAVKAKSTVYGSDGSSLSALPEECREYLSEYTRVKVMFVRRFDRLDDSGETSSLSETEIAAKTQKIEKIREYIENARAGLDNAMSPDAFDTFLRDTTFSDSDADFFDTGYYLHESAEQTDYFREAFPEVYEEAMNLSVGSFGEAEWESGVAFIYRLNVDENEYKNKDNLMLSDFYSDLADRLYPELLSEVGVAAEFTELISRVSVLDTPANTRLVATFGEEK